MSSGMPSRESFSKAVTLAEVLAGGNCEASAGIPHPYDPAPPLKTAFPGLPVRRFRPGSVQQRAFP
jgi:hypothetical protein